ncbi:carbohydrate ABC transporter permease [Microbispora sp. NPDC046933]|uniref:carbohydrate ABC transporter permease n=1 Tax=Microbispora sp. NPDC046933 TaxID=3155618 RepID=UPI0033EA5428
MAARRLSRYSGAQWLGSAGLLIVAACFLLPFVWMLSTSFRTQGDLESAPTQVLPQHFTWVNYIHIWHYIPLGRDLANTVIFAGLVTVASVFLDALAGYAFARYDFRGKNVWFMLVLLTLMVPISITFIPVYEFLSQLGWLNTFQGLIVPRIADAFGIFFFRQFFTALPKELEEAARIDGAGEFRIFLTIMAPLAGPAVVTVGLFNFIANWNDLLWPLMVTSDADMQTLPASLALFKGQHNSDYGLLMAGSVIALVPVIVLFLVAQRRFVSAIATSGIK